jgi:hypothetical protein
MDTGTRKPRVTTDLAIDPNHERLSRRLRRASLALESVTLIGVGAGIQGFLSGAFVPLVDQLAERLPLDGPVVPAVGLGLVVGVSQGASLVMGARDHPRAAEASLIAGSVLAGWIVAQLPLIGWTQPVQWAVLGVSVAEVAVSAAWLRTRRAISSASVA